jgi:hypothetical protein
VNLRDADLHKTDLSKVDTETPELLGEDWMIKAFQNSYFSNTDLREADLRGANLTGTNLRKADLMLANLGSANLRATDLIGADLEAANLRGANLIWANLRGANLRATFLSGAIVDELTLLYSKRIKGGQIGVNGIWSEDTDSAALITLTPPGNSMEGPNPDAVIESLKRARRVHGYSLSLVGIMLLIAALTLQEISFPYAKDVSISPAQFGKIAMPISIALLFLVNIFLVDALKGARYLNDRVSVMYVGKFPWIISKFMSIAQRPRSRDMIRGPRLWDKIQRSGIGGKILFFFRWDPIFHPRFIMSFHGLIYIYYVKKWEIFNNPVFYILSALLIIFSLWTMVLSQRFQKPILFDRETEEERQNDLARLTKAVEAQTKSIDILTDLFKQNKNSKLIV